MVASAALRRARDGGQAIQPSRFGAVMPASPFVALAAWTWGAVSSMTERRVGLCARASGSSRRIGSASPSSRRPSLRSRWPSDSAGCSPLRARPVRPRPRRIVEQPGCPACGYGNAGAALEALNEVVAIERRLADGIRGLRRCPRRVVGSPGAHLANIRRFGEALSRFTEARTLIVEILERAPHVPEEASVDIFRDYLALNELLRRALTTISPNACTRSSSRGEDLGNEPRDQRTSAGSSLPCSRSRPRWTAAMNFERLTSRVLRISSA